MFVKTSFNERTCVNSSLINNPGWRLCEIPAYAAPVSAANKKILHRAETCTISSKTSLFRMSSSKIVSISWGRIDLEPDANFKDAKLFPGGARAWDWNETGTRHSPGIQQSDVEELVQAGATEVVLSRGMDEKLGVPDSTVRWLEDKGVKVHVAETRKAVEIYNRLLEEGVKVGGCFHSTC